MNEDHYGDYLKTIHSKLVTPDEIIRNVVREATRSDISSKRRIIAGEGNEVYEVGLSDHPEVIVRVSGYEDKNFEQEKWAIEQCQRLRIPVPEVLLIKHLSHNGKNLDICVQRKLEGEPLERGNIDFRSLPETELRPFIVQAGEILSRIHIVETNGFGYLNGKGEGPFKTFSDLMGEDLDKEDKFVALAERVNLDPEIMKKIFRILRDKLRVVPNVVPVLNHNDFGPKHIMIKDGKISGILDFGEVAGNSPVNDFAKWDYWFGDEIPLGWLKEGYSNKGLFGSGFEELLHWIKLKNGLSVLWWYDHREYLKGIEDAKTRLNRELSYFT